MSGDVVALLALAVLVFEQTGSSLASALTFALSFVPYVVGGTLLSSIADRFPARRALIYCDLVSAGLVALMAVPRLPLPLLLVLLVPLGAIGPVSNGTRAAILPDVLSAEGFPLGRSLIRMVTQASQVWGFGLGGLLLAVLQDHGGARALLLLDVVSFLVSATILRFGIKRRPARAQPETDESVGGRLIAHDSVVGLRLALGSPRLRPLLLLYWLPPAFTIAPEALAAPYAHQLGQSPAAVGLLLAASPAGNVAGMWLAGSLLSPAARVRLLLPMASSSMLPLVGFAAQPGLVPAVTLLTLVGMAWAYSIGLDQCLLEATPTHLRGRVLSLTTSGLIVSQGLAFAAAGAVGEFVSPHIVIAASGIAGLLVVRLLASRAAIVGS
jgi:MFS family permease